MYPLLDPDARPIIAHRGASARAPENTLPAFELALEEGADALELDVHLTADGVPVVVHDPTLDRTTDVTGRVAALPLDRIREADAGARFVSATERSRMFPWRGQGVRIPTLDEVLTAFPGVPYIIEIKAPAAAEAVQRALIERGAAERSVLMSFDPAALEAFRVPPWITGATSSEALRLISHAFLGRPIGEARYRALSVPERYRGFPVPLRALAASARRLGRPVHVWVVNSPARARALWTKGVAGIVTNNPREIRQERDRA
jgi:glycerophosphoryl diester phosphodiesterase